VVQSRRARWSDPAIARGYQGRRLNEPRTEQRKLPNLANRAFTREEKPITSIRSAFELAKERAKVNDVMIHDLRHTAITRWASVGLPQEIAMAASGHKSLAMHYRYVNLRENHVNEAFNLFTQRLHRKRSSRR